MRSVIEHRLQRPQPAASTDFIITFSLTSMIGELLGDIVRSSFSLAVTYPGYLAWFPPSDPHPFYPCYLLNLHLQNIQVQYKDANLGKFRSSTHCHLGGHFSHSRLAFLHHEGGSLIRIAKSNL